MAGQQLHRVDRQLPSRQDITQNPDERGVGPLGGGRPTQQHRIAGLQREPGGVHRHVGPAFVDHAEHTERHPQLPQFQPVGQGAAPHHLADRIRQLGDGPQPLGHRSDALRSQGQAVDQIRGHIGLVRDRPIGLVGLDDLRGAFEQCLGHGDKSGVLLAPRQQRGVRSGRTSPSRGIEHLDPQCLACQRVGGRIDGGTRGVPAFGVGVLHGLIHRRAGHLPSVEAFRHRHRLSSHPVRCPRAA